MRRGRAADEEVSERDPTRPAERRKRTDIYRIHPILCEAFSIGKRSTTCLTDRDVELVFPVYAFLLLLPADDADPAVLVDAGVKSADSAHMRREGREVGPAGGGPEPLLDRLADHGVTPGDVDYLVLTHLHHENLPRGESRSGADGRRLGGPTDSHGNELIKLIRGTV